MGIFRKDSLDRLSSPEEMDQLMQITGPREWLVLATVLLLLAAASGWCFWGSVATVVAGQGAIVRRGGVRNVVTSGAGVISRLDVHPGDHIQEGQVVAHVEQPGMTLKVDLARRALQEAERVHLDTMHLDTTQAHLQRDTILKREQNARQQIARLRDQIKLAQDQTAIQQGLQQKGLVTHRQVVDAYQQVAALETELANREAEINQLESDRYGWEKKPAQQDLEMQEKILDLQAHLAEAEKASQVEGQVVSAYDGEVIELQAYTGERVDMQTPIVSVQPAANNLEVVAYIPSLRAKEIWSGMEVQISPSIVKREEYGFLRGRVLDVGAFPVTKAALMKNFENENLLSAFASESPVTELHIVMNTDVQTRSGYAWSSSKGPPIQLSSGMLCSLQVVTLRQRPIELILPLLRHQVDAVFLTSSFGRSRLLRFTDSVRFTLTALGNPFA